MDYHPPEQGFQCLLRVICQACKCRAETKAHLHVGPHLGGKCAKKLAGWDNEYLAKVLLADGD